MPVQHSSTLKRFMESDVLLVKPMQHGRIYVELRNGSKGVCDLTSLLIYEAFQALNEPIYFAQVRIVGGSVTWPNGEDLAPETVMACLQPQAA
jgi:hypothetical protein